MIKDMNDPRGLCKPAALLGRGQIKPVREAPHLVPIENFSTAWAGDTYFVDEILIAVFRGA